MSKYTSVGSGTDTTNITSFTACANYTHSGINYDEYKFLVIFSNLDTSAENNLTFRFEDGLGDLVHAEETVTVPTGDDKFIWYSNKLIMYQDATHYMKVKSDNPGDTNVQMDFAVLSPLPRANMVQISGGTTAADNAEAFFDGSGYNAANSTIGTTTTNADMRGTDNAATAANLATTDGKVDTIDGLLDGIIAGTSKVTPIDVDGLTFASAMEVLLAVLAGVSSVDGSTITFNKRDGSTAKIEVTVGSADGVRTTSTIQ